MPYAWLVYWKLASADNQTKSCWVFKTFGEINPCMLLLDWWGFALPIQCSSSSQPSNILSPPSSPCSWPDLRRRLEASWTAPMHLRSEGLPMYLRSESVQRWASWLWLATTMPYQPGQDQGGQGQEGGVEGGQDGEGHSPVTASKKTEQTSF